MTAKIRCVLTLCCLCLIDAGVIPPGASATLWSLPENAKEWSDLRSCLLQGSENIVLARIDSCGEADQQTVACTALEYFKGGRFPLDRFSYSDRGLNALVKGERYLLFLSRSAKYARMLTFPPHRYYISDDDRTIELPLYTASWPSYRDSVVNELATLTPRSLASTADCAIRGTTTEPQLVGSTWRKHGSLGIRVRANYTTPAAAESNSVVLLDFPSGEDARWKWMNTPAISPDRDVILLLDRAPSGHFTLHGGLYGMWSVSGDSARVAYPTPGAYGPLTTLAVMLTDSLLAMVNKR